MKSQLINPELFDNEKYDENKIKESAETLLEADEIRKDAILMKNINKYWDKQGKKIDSIKKLKEVAQSTLDNEDQE